MQLGFCFKNRGIHVFLLVFWVFSGFLLYSPYGQAEEKVERLKLVWIAHDAARSLASIAKRYFQVTGIEIEVIMLPYGEQWHNRLAAEFASHGDGFDLAVWDSQTLAEFANGGHIEQLNHYLEQSSLLHYSDFETNSFKRYGEYPDASGSVWAIPINQDAVGMVYRKDLFDDPEEQDKFQKIYGYKLAVPRTYSQLSDIAEFFTRPESGLFGWGQFSSVEYDFASSAANGFIWSYGGELWNSRTKEVKGYLNSLASIDGFKHYLRMFDYMPIVARQWGYIEINDYFKQGKLAMAMQWFSYFEELSNPARSDYADKTGFAVLPGAIGRDNQFRKQFSMGGQGIGINAYSNKKQQAWAFIEWFMQDEQQWAFSTMGQTARLNILQSPRWQTLNGYNKACAEAMSMVNDYWHLPEYIKLLEILQEEMVSAIHGKKSAEKALTDAANRQEQLLLDSGYTIVRSSSISDVPNLTVLKNPYKDIQ